MATLSCNNESGFIAYGTNDGGSGGSGGHGGGFGGGGAIWSSQEQVIWISAGGLRYPVYLKPGWNDVKFWVPYIFPEDTWIESPIIIETEGYILIPAGFEWTFVTGKDAPYIPGNQKMADKLKFVDCYDLEILSKPVSVDLDNIIEELGYSDFTLTELIGVAIKEVGQLEELGYEDIHSLELQISEPEEDIEITKDNIDISDSATIVDLVNTDTINVTITDNQNGVESTGFSDIFDIEI